MSKERYDQIIDEAYENYIKDCILFDEISNNRIARTIIGCPSSTDITSYIDPESDWGAVDYLTGEKIKYEDCDNGVIYFNQKIIKISSLKQIGVVGLRCESLHRSLDESNFIYNKEEFINKIKTDNEFAKEWGLKIEERELSLEERAKWLQDTKGYDLLVGNLEHDHIREVVETESPTKLITLTYNNKTIEVYEPIR